jgi:hypothetical protein
VPSGRASRLLSMVLSMQGGCYEVRRHVALFATPLDPLMPARAQAVVVVAAHLGAVTIEVDANRSTPAAAFARATMAIRRELGGVDGRGGHRRSSTTGRASSSPRHGHRTRVPPSSDVTTRPGSPDGAVWQDMGAVVDYSEHEGTRSMRE